MAEEVCRITQKTKEPVCRKDGKKAVCEQEIEIACKGEKKKKLIVKVEAEEK